MNVTKDFGLVCSVPNMWKSHVCHYACNNERCEFIHIINKQQSWGVKEIDIVMFCSALDGYIEAVEICGRMGAIDFGEAMNIAAKMAILKLSSCARSGEEKTFTKLRVMQLNTDILKLSNCAKGGEQTTPTNTYVMQLKMDTLKLSSYAGSGEHTSLTMLYALLRWKDMLRL